MKKVVVDSSKEVYESMCYKCKGAPKYEAEKGELVKEDYHLYGHCPACGYRMSFNLKPFPVTLEEILHRIEDVEDLLKEIAGARS